MIAKLHTYAGGQLCLMLECENKTERALLDFLFKRKEVSFNAPCCFPNPDQLCIQSEHRIVKK
jgi:hypothetical protein